MVELKFEPCAGLVNAASSALCAIHDQAVKGEVNAAIAEISAELQREREKNAQLMLTISALQVQLQDQQTYVHQESCQDTTERSIKKFKRQKLRSDYNGIKERNVVVNGATASQVKQDSERNANVIAGKLVNWMSMDDTQFLNTDKSKDEDLVVDREDDTEDSEEECECEGKICMNAQKHQSGVDSMTLAGENNKETSSDMKKCVQFPSTEHAQYKKDLPQLHQKGTARLGSVRKPPKMAFCPNEVKRMLESEILSSKNAQAHTIRKIIVFATLGIRHGCDDIYELDFNHFSIQRRGEPYVSSKDPGEHVLYENPGAWRKMFFPNHQNPILCPVQILEEEKAMRPGDPSCPSCLFLCIKYGGRTRNLPQNEYVRQRMGRNKLKSFGPEMCRMAMLVHIREGSFFFKALGITLLFMAGFPDELVQRETKYRNVDLLQKYYRTDEDAEGDELFHPQPLIYDTHGIPSYRKLIEKTISSSTKSQGKKQSKPDHKYTRFPIHQNVASTSASSPTRFGLVGSGSVHQNQAMTSQGRSSSASFYPFHMPANVFMPMMYWSPQNAFPPPNPYGFQAFPSNPNCISVHPQPYYTHASLIPTLSEKNASLIPTLSEKNWKKNDVEEEGETDSDTNTSSTTQPNKVLANSCK
ncbi:hypothetical protein M5689_002415 [Euphorbia peplus]|nr:hypothetical protein M5689_002415 [Euphorbia peplus]